MKSAITSAEILPSLQALLGEAMEGPAEGFLDLLPVGIYVCDREGHVIDYNRTAAELWGRAPRRGDPAERFCGSYRMHSLDGRAVPRGECPMAEVLSSGEAVRDGEIIIERHDGTRLAALVNIEPIRDSDGELIGAVNVFRDNSEQYRHRTHLGEHSRRLGTLLQAMPAAIYTTDAEGRITFYNEAAAALWGVRPELGSDQFCGSWKLYWPDGRPMPHDRCPMAMALKSKAAIQGMEAVCERPDGTRVPFLAYPTPLYDPSGKLTGAVSVLLNMAEQHEMHSRLRSSEARFRAIVDNAQVSVWEEDFSEILDFLDALRAAGIEDLRAHLAADPVWLRQAIARLRITGVNRFTLELFEAAHEDALLDAFDTILLPETERIFVELLVALWEGRDRFEGETVVRTLTGRRLDVVASIAFVGERAERSVACVHDVTQRKANELVAQRLAAIVESSQDAIVAKNLDGIITNWNHGAERLFGYTAEEAVGQPITMLIPADRHDEEAAILSRIRHGRRVEPYETVRQRKDGSLVHISLAISPIKAADGTVVGASKVARDMTERLEAEEQQLLLLREMNHRIKNLLTLSSGLVSLSARYAKTPDELAAVVKERLNALARAQEIILPKTDARHESDHTTCLQALIRTIVSPYHDPQRDNPARIEVRGGDIKISGRSATSFALLLHEFATNAAKYGALSVPHGRVGIECREEGDRFLVIWQEYGGPPASGEDDGKGFGDVLTRATVTGHLRGELIREWGPDGLTIRLSTPKDRLTG
jgi:PAS domain S-box-containing protein